MKDDRSRRVQGVVLTLLLLLALTGLYVGSSGFGMAGSMAVAEPQEAAHWERVALLHLALAGVSLLATIVAAVALWRWYDRYTSVRQ